MVDEIVAELFGRDEGLIALGQRALDIDAGGHIERGHQRRPVGQRQGGAIEDQPVGPFDPRRPALAMVGKIDDHRPEVVEKLGLAAQRLAGARDLVDVRAGAQDGRVEAPERGEGRIEQLHAPVGAERRHALLERVERLALHVGERVDLRGERVALRGVVIEIGDAAFRIGAGDDAQGAPVRQMPDGLAWLDCAIGVQLLRLPGGKVDLLRQLPLGAERIEDFAVARPLVEEGRLERPDLPVGGIVQG